MRTLRVYYKDGSAFRKLAQWSRPIFLDDKIDDELNEGDIDFNTVPLQELPPFTTVWIGIFNSNNVLEKEYYLVTAEFPEEMSTFSLA